ncbi:MAG: type I methionyl aminopeptidase [Candidatus Zixiibacteriota bacterium]
MISVKTRDQIEQMRLAGRLVAETLDLVERMIRPGMKTAELDKMAEEFIRAHGAEPAFKGYLDYPATLCISVDDVVVHGIPGERELREGQIVSVDVGVCRDGWYGDAARTLKIGEVPSAAERLMSVTQEALRRGIAQARSGHRLGDISAAVQTYAEENGYSVVRDLVGHGIGRKMHEEPQVPNFGRPHTGPTLKPGIVLAIEPMINAGGPRIQFDADKWTVRTADGSLSAHFEHTVAITENGPDVLTVVAGGV